VASAVSAHADDDGDGDDEDDDFDDNDMVRASHLEAAAQAAGNRAAGGGHDSLSEGSGHYSEDGHFDEDREEDAYDEDDEEGGVAEDSVLGPTPDEVADELGGEDEDNEESLNSADDLDEEEEAAAGGQTSLLRPAALNTDGGTASRRTGEYSALDLMQGENLMLARFDKVKRAGELWRLILRGGHATLYTYPESPGVAYAFARLDCEFTY